MTRVGGVLWFIWRSWSYLGCDRGTGRWAARREYLVGIIPAAVRFVRSSWNDDRTGGAR
jgi:hypothetical protein